MEQLDDLIIIRKKRNGTGQFAGHGIPMLSITIPSGRCSINMRAAELIGLQDSDAVMLAISKSARKAFIFKEEPDMDNYTVRFAGEKRHYFRFTSKDVAAYLEEVFGPMDGKRLFEVMAANGNSYHPLILKK